MATAFYRPGGTQPPGSNNNNNNEARPVHQVSSGYSNILIPTCVIIIPMLVLPAVLLGVIFHYKVGSDQPLFSTLQGNLTGLDSDAYYVDVQTTTLATISSWCSSIALSLVSFAMTLWTYSISRSLLHRSLTRSYTELPTPFQFALILKIVGGGMGALWDFLLYSVTWGNRRSKLSPVVSAATAVFSVGITLRQDLDVPTNFFEADFVKISLSIIGSDQWLHLSTKSVNIPQAYPSENYSQSGKGLALSCINDDQVSIDVPCTIVYAGPGDYLTNGSIVFATLANVSSTNQVELIVQDSLTYAILSDPSTAADLDYSTTTFGVSTSCKPIGAECNWFQPMGDTATFNCAPLVDFRGECLSEIGMVQYELQFYENSAGTQNASDVSFVNPFYFAFSVNIDSVDEYYGEPGYMMEDPNSNIPDRGLCAIHWCEVSVFDVSYSRVNGSIVSLSATQSNATLGGMVLSPLLNAFVIDKWMESLRLAAFTNNSQAMADQFALTVSQTGIGLISGQLSPRLNYEEQVRFSILAARVSKAPLYTLVILCLLYSLFGIVLGILALYFSGEADIQELQVRLGIPALVAEAFESDRSGRQVEKVEELFQEWDSKGNKTICAKRNAKGGLKFEAL